MVKGQTQGLSHSRLSQSTKNAFLKGNANIDESRLLGLNLKSSLGSDKNIQIFDKVEETSSTRPLLYILDNLTLDK